MTQQEGGKLLRLLLKCFDADSVTATSTFLSAVIDIASMGLVLGFAVLCIR